MKISVRYFFFILVLALLAGIQIFTLSTVGTSVEEFRGSNIESGDFTPIMAAQINGSSIILTVGGNTYTSEKDGLYANDDALIMMPTYILRDAMGCSARIYDENELRIHKRQLEISMKLGENTALLPDEDTAELKAPLTKSDDNYYVCADDMAALLDYDWQWSMADDSGNLVDEQPTANSLPIRFDLREQQRVSGVKDQGDLGTCWAFGTLLSLESSLKPEQNLEFAEDHMSISNGYLLEQEAGGDYTMSMAYLASWKGPVLASDDPYGDGVTDESLEAVKHVQEIQILDSGDLNAIKSAVFKYGGVQTSMYNSIRDQADYDNPNYNPDTYAYCYQGAEKPNHDIIIVGWDDSFSADNFVTPPEDNGAFICQNSWGEEFGDKGYFYISYYDSNISMHNIVFTRVEDTDNYDRIYQVDECGWVGQIGYDRDSIYGANIFKAKSDGIIRAAGFYATSAGSSYEVYVVKDFEDITSLDEENRISVGNGSLVNAGYYTIDFDKEVSVSKGERFAIMIRIVSPGTTHPMAVEYVADEATANVDITDGEGYISVRGNAWNRVEEYAEGNLCIKAYADDK